MEDNSLAEVCPLVTPYTREFGIPDDTLQRLYKVRAWDIESGVPIPMKWPSSMRTHFPNGEPIRIREYQKQAAHSLARMVRFILGDGVGLGKTASSITACCWLKDRMPRQKVIVLATKSVTHQWASEFEAFSTLRARVMEDKWGKLKGHPARLAQMREFLENDDHDVLVCKYSALIGRRKKITSKFDDEGNPVRGGKERIASEVLDFQALIKPYKAEVILILDEAQKIKTRGVQTNVMAQVIQQSCGHVWGLTATAIKNTLDEFYSIAYSIGIRPLGSMAEFYDKFCIFRDMPIGKGRVISKIVGYQHVADFKAGMRPFFLGRSQKQVKEKMPKLQTRIHPIDLDPTQKKLLFEDIPNGTFVLPPALVKIRGELLEKERDPDNLMTAMSVMQLVANHPALLDHTDKEKFFTKSLSPKEEALIDLLDGELKGESVIVYSSFKMHIDRLDKLTKEGHFTDRKFLRITGAEDEKQREEAKKLFQDPNSGYDLIFINSAATEGINLQQAAHMVTLDLPWSWGMFTQLIGRMLRMSSPHSACTLHILCAKGTLDEFTLETLKGKKNLFAKILGESHTTGLLDDSEVENLQSGMEHVETDAEFASLLKAHVKSSIMKNFIDGTHVKLAEGQGDAYKVGGDKPKPKRKPHEEDLAELHSLWR